MAVNQESGFGARLQNAQTLATYLQAFANYNPPKDEDNAENFNGFVQKCADSNTQVATCLQDYTLAVKNRTDAFAGKQASALKLLLSPILKAVHAQYGKDTREYTSVANMIGKLRSNNLPKTNPEGEEEEKATISQSELSYGSQLQNFRDLVASLGQLQGFKPTNELITLDALRKQIEVITKYNNEVITKKFPLKQAREQRTAFFTDLNVRAQRIKSYVASMYGNKSSEYKAISNLKI